MISRKQRKDWTDGEFLIYACGGEEES